MTLRLLLLLWVLLAELPIYAQVTPRQLDSLKKQSKLYLKKDSVRIELLITLGDALSTIDPKEAMQYSHAAFQLAQEIKSPMGVAVFYRQMGNIYVQLNDYTKAVDYNYKALKAAENLKKNNRGTTLFVASIHNNLGVVYLAMSDYDKAIAGFANFLKVIKKLNSSETRREETITLLNLGEAHARKKLYKQGLEFTGKALSMAEKDRDYQVAAYVLSSIGIAYINLKQPEQAIEALKKGIAYADKAGDLRIKSTLVGGLADALFDVERYDESEKYAKEALQVAKNLELPDIQRQITQLLAYIYIAQKKSQLAITYLETSLALRDSILNDDKKQEIARKEERFAQEKRAAVLAVQNAAELQQQQTQRNILLAAAAGLLVILGMSFLLYKRKRDAAEKIKVAQFNALVSDSKLKVLQSQIKPHFFFNALNSISNYVLNNEPLTAYDYLTKFASLMRSILTNSDQAQVSLADDMKTLDIYIQLESLRFDHRFTYQITVDPAIDRQRTMVPPLLLQPFVENSIWHGLSEKPVGGELLIHIQADHNMLVCSVTDNGVGRKKTFQIEDAQLERKSYGIAITKERVAILNQQTNQNGTVSLLDLQEGTEATVKLPLIIA